MYLHSVIFKYLEPSNDFNLRKRRLRGGLTLIAALWFLPELNITAIATIFSIVYEIGYEPDHIMETILWVRQAEMRENTKWRYFAEMTSQTLVTKPKMKYVLMRWGLFFRTFVFWESAEVPDEEIWDGFIVNEVRVKEEGFKPGIRKGNVPNATKTDTEAPVRRQGKIFKPQEIPDGQAHAVMDYGDEIDFSLTHESAGAESDGDEADRGESEGGRILQKESDSKSHPEKNGKESASLEGCASRKEKEREEHLEAGLKAESDTDADLEVNSNSDEDEFSLESTRLLNAPEPDKATDSKTTKAIARLNPAREPKVLQSAENHKGKEASREMSEEEGNQSSEMGVRTTAQQRWRIAGLKKSSHSQRSKSSLTLERRKAFTDYEPDDDLVLHRSDGEESAPLKSTIITEMKPKPHTL
ncbi:hypothetical protein EJ08DRAFT_693418 [Tothia fuscella]|uniref:Uncharacterized protein n=1 Tax=Tothia fuscella TaxID=1048955 RepID=A0A9P4U2V6_9PEZI|nr:hypothetical protein EJ08DRAFT_693418 [Tothia fuscella]